MFKSTGHCKFKFRQVASQYTFPTWWRWPKATCFLEWQLNPVLKTYVQSWVYRHNMVSGDWFTETGSLAKTFPIDL